MSIEHEKKILEILDEVLELPPRERQTFLDKVCGNDQALRRGVEALIETEIDSGPLAEPAFDIHAEDVGIGRRIGGYQLVRLLDRGGMGSVYLAEREDFEQQVALKLIRRGLDADPMLVRRFQNERQILARLQHRHIAGLLDGGTTTDRLPYFVMEYVEGERIDRYCQAQKLSIEERLVIFRKVCSAVQFAHQNLVIHRDLKPANILITEDSQPKLLDFGIAKLLDDSLAAKAVETVLGQGAMTPRYASPEQIQLKQVTTTSDVYSLGVLLYELLTGLDPYGADSRRQDQVARAVCEREPDRPSTAVRRRSVNPEAIETRELTRQLSGDLDSIVLKAMRKEPHQRYASAEQLSEDIRRYLEGLPVEAQTGTFTYRAGKFVRRHRLGMAIIAAVFLLGLAFGTLATIFALREARKAEENERKRLSAQIELEKSLDKQAELERTQEASDFLVDLFNEADPTRAAGEDITALQILRRGRQKVTGLTQPVLKIDVAGSLGEIFKNLGSYDESKEMMELSLNLAQDHYGEVDVEVAKRLNNLAVLLFETGEYEGAEDMFRRALRMKEDLNEDPPTLFRIKSNLATTLLRRGNLDEAEKLCSEVLQARVALYQDEEHDTDVATSMHNLAVIYYAQGRFEDAERLLREALDSRRRRLASTSPHPTKKPVSPTQVAATLDLLGSVVAELDYKEEAKELYLEALGMRGTLLPPSHRDIARTRKNLAILSAQSAPDVARDYLDDAIPIFHDFRPDGWDATEAKSIEGMIETTQGNYERAEGLLIESYDRMVELRGAETYRSRLALQRIIDLYTKWGKKPEDLKRYQTIADSLPN